MSVSSSQPTVSCSIKAQSRKEQLLESLELTENPVLTPTDYSSLLQDEVQDFAVLLEMPAFPTSTFSACDWET